MEEGVAPTDSRHRPDQRLMEVGRWEESNVEKMRSVLTHTCTPIPFQCGIVLIHFPNRRLEEKQRKARRQREADAENAAHDGIPFAPYEPLWFEKVKDEDCEGFDHLMHVFKGNYWKAKENGDWEQCPQIF